MRTLIKSLFKGISGFLMILMIATTLMPATTQEAAALGPNTDRPSLVQMRVARAMMNVAPDFTVTQYAKATGVPKDMIRDVLEFKAAGGTDYAQETGFAQTPVQQTADTPTNRRTEAGGALFVRPN